ncbi:unnamed protein product [Durusdinium trenchii]|uniref:Non-specific serine/threonine protein kinase n=2 Tax=Durusdinium trenchii TaxID=1381693 RepID=A0ABP0Q6K2_9DINO
MVTSPYSLLTLAVLIPLAAASADHTALQHLDAGNSTEVVVPKLSHGPVFLKLKSAETAGSQKGDPDCYYIMGLSKFSWAFICDLLALVVILLCIPLLLSCSKRRPLGASMFEFKLFGDEPNPMGIARLALLLVPLAVHAASPVGKVITLLENMEVNIADEGKAEKEKMAKYSAMCEKRTAELKYQIKTAQTDVDELSARISKADSKAEAATSSIQEKQVSIATDQGDLKAAGEVRQKERAEFTQAQKELLEVNSAVERAMSTLEKEESKSSALFQVKSKGVGSLIQAVQAMLDASMIGHEDAKTLTSLVQDSDLQPDVAAYKSKSGGIMEMLEDMMDKSKEELQKLGRKETEAKHSYEMLTQSLQDQVSFAEQEVMKTQKIQAEQSRVKAEAEKDLEQTKTSLAENEKTLSDFTLNCKSEAADYEEGVKSRSLELQALKAAKGALKESSGLSLLQLDQHHRSVIQSTEDLKHFEVVRMVRTLGQKMEDRQLVLLSRRMDSMLRSEAGSGADIFAKIKTMINDMITSMQENLQAEATKKQYCDAEMGKAKDKKATKESDLDTVSTRLDAAASKSASLKKQVAALKSQLAVLAETQANMTQLRQEEKELFAKKEPETETGMEGVKSALRTLRDFYRSSGLEVTSGERKGTAGGVIGRLEDVEADMAMSLSQMRSAEKSAETNFEKDMQDMKLEKVQKEKDISYKSSEAQRLDSELNSLNSDQESLQTEMGALMDFLKSLEAECLVTPESFAEKQAKKQQEIAGCVPEKRQDAAQGGFERIGRYGGDIRLAPAARACAEGQCQERCLAAGHRPGSMRASYAARSVNSASWAAAPRARCFRALSHGLRGLARAQVIVDAGLPAEVDVVSLVRRIALTLAFPETFRKAITSLFDKLAEPKDGELQLHVKHVPEILAHWNIPEDHISMFWAQLRKLDAYFDAKALPEWITRKDLEAVFIKVLRRVRDKYSNSKVTKEQFITQNSKKFLEEYVMLDSCGKGSFGECFWVTHRISKMRRVCKKLPKEETNVPAEEVQMELEILKKLDHPNVLRCFEWFEEEASFLLVLEAAEGGDLRKLLTKQRQEHLEDKEAHPEPGLGEPLTRTLLEQALQGLACCHALNIMHRDIKPANMLLASADLQRPHLLLADFGVAEIFQEQVSFNGLVRGTFAYMAPEVLENKACSASDVWAMGVVAYELISGERPFVADAPLAMYAALRNQELNMEPVRRAEASPQCVSFIEQILVKDPSCRPKAKELLSDGWCCEAKQATLQGRHARKARKSIVSFAQMSHFSKAALNCMAAQLDTHKIENLADAFASLDLDHDGKLSTSEFADGLAEMGVELEVIHQLVGSIDMDCDGHINYTEFVASLLHVQGKLLDEVVFHAFQIFDLNGDGHISLDELRMMLSGQGPLSAVLPDGKTVEQALKDLDTSGDGVVSFDEFKAYLARDAHPEEAVEVPQPWLLEKSPTPADSLIVDLEAVPESESLESVMQTLSSLLGRPEAELKKEASRLSQEHWISQVADLKKLDESDWPRLGMPLKLEKVLRQHIAGS